MTGIVDGTIRSKVADPAMSSKKEQQSAGAEKKTTGDRVDGALEGLERRKAASRRTAWIIAAIAIAFFIASLVHGHYVGIPNWVPPGH